MTTTDANERCPQCKKDPDGDNGLSYIKAEDAYVCSYCCQYSTPAEVAKERERRKARERKAAQRKRDEKLDMQPWGGKFSSGERKRIAAGAAAGGFEDQTEYLFSLVLKDTKGLKL